jgi:hypothetical protein
VKIFKLTWIVTEGLCQYFLSEWFVFTNQESADSFGISFEYEENTGHKSDQELTKDERKRGRDIGSKYRKKCLEFLDASKVTIIETPNDELFDVTFNLKKHKEEGS